jgi:hypothetical protein
MQDFTFYLQQGWHHILSWDALDHILFILALCAVYLLTNWKQVLILITAFTIGHSVTLALSVFNLLIINDTLVETLIPCTILANAIFNVLQKDFTAKALRLNYFLALLFGLIHGLGFANTLRFMLAKGQSIGWSLLAFNIGLEFGQIIVVAIILFISFLVVDTLKLQRKWWVWTLSAISFCIALKILIERVGGLMS